MKEQEKERAQIERLKTDLKTAKQTYVSGVQARDYRLLKLTLVMVIIALIAGFITGRIPI